MRKNAKKVLEAFAKGKACNEKSISTNGKEVFSYNMMIARKSGGQVEVIDYDASPSVTTTTQIHACLVYFGDKVVKVSKF